MSVNVKEIKERIERVENTKHITNAMHIVSSTKFRKFQNLTLNSRKYSDTLDVAFDNLVASLKGHKYEIFDGKSEIKKVGMIVMTSDRGMCGSFNSNVLKKMEEMIRTFKRENKDVSVIITGKKAKDYCKIRNIPVDSEYGQFIPEIMFEMGKKISEDIVHAYLDDIYDEVYLIFSKFISAVEYKVKTEKILPIEKKEGLPNKEYIFEPSEEEVLRIFIPKVLNIKLYQALLESSASEHSARMTAMKQAGDNAQDMIKKLKVQYNRERQSLITQGLTEIISGSEVLR